MRDKSCTALTPHLPPIEDNGWKQDGYVSLRCINSPAPKAATELTKCGCKWDAKGGVPASTMDCHTPPWQMLHRRMWQYIQR